MILIIRAKENSDFVIVQLMVEFLSQAKQTSYWNGFLFEVKFVYGGRNNEYRKRYHDKKKRTWIDTASLSR